MIDKAWVTEAVRKHIEKHPISALTEWDLRTGSESIVEIRKVMLDMIGDGPEDLFAADGVYISTPCRDCGENIWGATEMTPALLSMYLPCPECSDYDNEEEQNWTRTIEDLSLRLELRPDCPLYEVAPERYHTEGVIAANFRLASCPYIRDSIPARQWEGGRKAELQRVREALESAHRAEIENALLARLRKAVTATWREAYGSVSLGDVLRVLIEHRPKSP